MWVVARHWVSAVLAALGLVLVAGCASTGGKVIESTAAAAAPTPSTHEYIIGPGDHLKIFVWRNPDVSVDVPVRPDGRISIPLVDNIVASGKTPTRLAHEIQKRLANYIKSPLVTVIVTSYVGTFQEQIRIVGAAARPQALPYRSGMTVLDVMIQVGGLTQYAAGNRATIVRRTATGEQQIRVRLDDLLERGDISANLRMQPGDILIIPESIF